MKVKSLFLLAVLFSFFMSCSNDDDSMTTDSSLTGEWKVTAIDYGGTTETVFQGGAATSDFTGYGYDMDFTIKFTENPNEFTSSGNYSIKLTTTSQGQSFESDVTDIGFINDGIWTKNGDQLVVSSTLNPDNQEATITELTETTLTMTWAFTEVTQLPQSAGTATTNVTGEYTFTRQ